MRVRPPGTPSAQALAGRDPGRRPCSLRERRSYTLARAPDNFVHAGHQVERFTVRRDIVAIEEVYVPVRLDGMLGAVEALARFRGPRGRFGWIFDVPVTIDPDGSRPTQSPPLTINP